MHGAAEVGENLVIGRLGAEDIQAAPLVEDEEDRLVDKVERWVRHGCAVEAGIWERDRGVRGNGRAREGEGKYGGVVVDASYGGASQGGRAALRDGW